MTGYGTVFAAFLMALMIVAFSTFAAIDNAASNLDNKCQDRWSSSEQRQIASSVATSSVQEVDIFPSCSCMRLVRNSDSRDVDVRDVIRTD